MSLKWILWFSTIVLLTGHTLDAAVVSDRPKVGLALSGGGTKAGAHIGVLRVLEEYHIPVDYIAGTSAGAIIGGLYAAGLSPNEIEAAIASIDWEDMLDDSPPRRDLPNRRKRDDFNYLVDYRPGYNDRKVTLPLGLIQGQKVTQFFRRYLEAYADTRDFDALPIPLRIVATDLDSGEPAIISSGDLALAIRASMSIAVLFAPVHWNAQRLIDGGPANNLPVDVVREMGADVVIAVDITAPLLTGEQIDSVLTIADQMTNLLIQRTVQAQIAKLGPSDILIRPDLEAFGGMDFDRTLDSVEPGEIAVRELQGVLMRLALDEEEYRHHRLRQAKRVDDKERRIRAVKLNNYSSISDDLIRNRLGFGTDDVLDQNRIERGITNIYGLDLFERVDYRIIYVEDDAEVLIDVVPKPWGPNYLQFGLTLSEDFSQGSEFNLGIAYLQTEVNPLGGEWRAQLDIGERQGISFDWYQPLGTRSRYFVEAEAQLQRRSFRFFEGNAALADVRAAGWGGTISAGSEIGHYGEVRFGWNRHTGDADVTVGTLELPDESLEIGEYFTSLVYDRIDNPHFPRKGMSASIGTFWSRESVGADSAFEQIAGSTFAVKSWGNNSILGRFEFGTTLDSDAPLESQFLLGGLGRLSGYPANRFVGQHYGLASLTAYRRLIRNVWVPVYAGFSIEAGNVWDDRALIGSDDLRFAGAAYAGADTPLGPVYVALGMAEGGENTLYLYLGNPFVSEGARPFD